MEGSSWEKVSTAWNGEEFLGTKRLCIPQIYIHTPSTYYVIQTSTVAFPTARFLT